jgi:phosphate transport system substrate-binding protein
MKWINMPVKRMIASHRPAGKLGLMAALLSLFRPQHRLPGLGWIMVWAGLLAACQPAPSHSGSPAKGLTAIIENKGSDTLVNLALAWAETYMRLNPAVRVSVTGGGSGTGIAALINGTVNIANASREMKAEEKAAARKNGINPVELTVARDAIAVVINPRNPVDRLTLQQISDIYTGRITNWKSLGGEDRPIVLLSRESNSGTYVYFLEQVIRLGQKDSDLLFSPETLLMPSSEGISYEVRQNPNAIGYDGLGYVTADMKTVAVAQDSSGAFVLPAISTVNDGTYPIARGLYMYIAGEPSGKIASYLDWISTEGQTLVAKLGFVPVD